MEINDFLKKLHLWAGEKPYWLRALVLVTKWVWIPALTWQLINTYNSSSKGSDALHGHQGTHTNTYMQATHIKINESKTQQQNSKKITPCVQAHVHHDIQAGKSAWVNFLLLLRLEPRDAMQLKRCGSKQLYRTSHFASRIGDFKESLDSRGEIAWSVITNIKERFVLKGLI